MSSDKVKRQEASKAVSRSDLVGLLQRFNAVINGRSGEQSLTLMHETGLTFPQIIVLYVLEPSGSPLTISQIAETTRLSPGAASQMVDRLVEGGYVSRAEDAEDRRVRRVALRPAGRK